MKRILLLSDINSSHTQRWASGLAERNEVGIFSLSKPTTDWYKEKSEIELLSKNAFGKDLFSKSILSKLSFLKSLWPLRNAIKRFDPNIVHAHYASSYGFLGALGSNRPLVITAWGSDIYHFPNTNSITKRVLKYSLNKANCITTSSLHLAEATKGYTKTNVEVVPFGIDARKFSVATIKKEKKQIVVGTVKAFEVTYGIDILIKSFSECKRRLPQYDLKLLLVGGGSLKNELITLAQRLGIINDIEFAGRISYDLVEDYYRRIDIFANLSRFESFGVSVLEASACGIPSVVTDAGGLKEVGIHNETCLYVRAGNVDETVQALVSLISDESKRFTLGKNARAFVEKFYTIQSSIEKMERIYDSVLAI